MTTPVECAIRPASAADLPAVNDIYNHFVRTCTCTYQETPETMPDRITWFAAHGPAHPVIIAESAGEVLGWGSLSPFNQRSGYRFSVEDSVYIRPDRQGRGLGTAILSRLVELARDHRYRTIVAGIDSLQPGSIALHKRFGFEQTAHLRQVGFKFNRSLDVIYMQLLLQQ